MKEGWVYYNKEKCYCQKLLGEWSIWSPSKGWVKYTVDMKLNKKI